MMYHFVNIKLVKINHSNYEGFLWIRNSCKHFQIFHIILTKNPTKYRLVLSSDFIAQHCAPELVNDGSELCTEAF